MRKFSSVLLILFIFTTTTIGIWAIDKESSQLNKPVFNSFSGKILNIEESHYNDGSKFLSVEAEDGSPANFLITKETFITEGTELKIGETITGYFDTSKPMLMIYPPQYSVEVIAGKGDLSDNNIYVGYFNDDLISFDNFLKINLSEETNLLNENNDYFSGDISYRKLIVYYNVSTRSIPAQTNPEKIIVLDKYYRDLENGTLSYADIVIKDKEVKNQKIYENISGTVYVPLRTIGENLGEDIVWNGIEEEILVGEKATLKIGSGVYKNIFGEITELREIPELKEGTTYVPLKFIKDILKIKNAFYFEGKIIVNNTALYK